MYISFKSRAIKERQDGWEIAESTFPWATVKHLADLLRNRVNSQWYSIIYEEWLPTLVEDIEKLDGKKNA